MENRSMDMEEEISLTKKGYEKVLEIYLGNIEKILSGEEHDSLNSVSLIEIIGDFHNTCRLARQQYPVLNVTPYQRRLQGLLRKHGWGPLAH